MDERIKKLINYSNNFIFSNPIYLNYLDIEKDFINGVLKDTQEILDNFNTKFKFERIGNKRKGAFSVKVKKELDGTKKIIYKRIGIKKDMILNEQIYVYFHELGHLVNQHFENNDKLSRPQKEFVADTLAISLYYSFCGGSKEFYNNNSYLIG
jgi:hypothetical protein